MSVRLASGGLAPRRFVFNLAAQQAYYFFFALFPALLAMISIASFFPIENLSDEVVSFSGDRRLHHAHGPPVVTSAHHPVQPPLRPIS